MVRRSPWPETNLAQTAAAIVTAQADTTRCAHEPMHGAIQTYTRRKPADDTIGLDWCEKYNIMSGIYRIAVTKHPTNI